MKKDIYQVPVADIIVLNVVDVITASDPYVDDIDWDL